MRPYLAVLKDSFREALVSRVLWILLLIWSVVLLAIVPVGLQEQAGAFLRANDIRKTQSFIAKLRTQGAALLDSPGKQIWKRLSTELRADLEKYPQPGAGQRPPWEVQSNLFDELNGILEAPDLYQPGVWKPEDLSNEAKALLDRGLDELPADQLARFNRLLLEAAFPGEIAPSKQTQLRIRYLVSAWSSPFPMEMKTAVNLVLSVVINFFVGVAGVFIGVLVTASIVPQTFEPGAIDLLLSKPVSRVLLFLTKFLGGCAFILLNACYFIGGLWLICGVRFGVWSNKLLWCVPVFMFLFAIYYAVSSLAGVIWRNAIVSVVISILFWCACFGMGVLKIDVFDEWLLDPTRLIKIAPAGKDLFVVNEQNMVLRFNRDTNAWAASFDSKAAKRDLGVISLWLPLVGPVYDEKHQRLLAITSTSGPMGVMSGGSRLQLATAADEWKRLEGIDGPDNPIAVWLDDQGEFLAAGTTGIFKLQGDPLAKAKRMEVLGFEIPLGGAGGRFVPQSPRLQLSPEASIHANANDGSVAIYDRPELAIYKRNEDGKYEQKTQTKLSTKESGLTAIGRQFVLLALKNGSIELFDAESLKPVTRFEPRKDQTPRFAIASPDGRWFGVLFHDRHLWLYDAVERQERSGSITGQGEISAAIFDKLGNLLVADRFTRVTSYNPDTLAITQSWTSTPEWSELCYRFAVKPLYAIFPKPGEMGDVVQYLLLETDRLPADGDSDNLQGARVKLNIWQPIWSNLGFLVVTLGLGSLYVYRKDF